MLVAFGANLLIAVAKSVAAVVTGSASMLAEAAHSWADAGNEVFLLVADRRSRRPADPQHPFGHGREAYVWSLFAALGLFVAGAAVSVTHGIQELITPEPAQRLRRRLHRAGASRSCWRAISFLQSVRQAKPEAESLDRDLIEHVLATSDPTLRAVFAEDAAALIGLVIAAAGLGAHQITGSPVPDAIGSILVGVLLGVVAMVLINRNRRFLVGQEADPRVRAAVIQALLDAAGGGPGDVSAAGDRRAADGVGDRRRRPHRRRHRVARGRPAAGAGGEDQRVARGGRRGAQPLRARRAHPRRLDGARSSS